LSVFKLTLKSREKYDNKKLPIFQLSPVGLQYRYQKCRYDIDIADILAIFSICLPTSNYHHTASSFTEKNRNAKGMAANAKKSLWWCGAVIRQLLLGLQSRIPFRNSWIWDWGSIYSNLRLV